MSFLCGGIRDVAVIISSMILNLSFTTNVTQYPGIPMAIFWENGKKSVKRNVNVDFNCSLQEISGN